MNSDVTGTGYQRLPEDFSWGDDDVPVAPADLLPRGDFDETDLYPYADESELPGDDFAVPASQSTTDLALPESISLGEAALVFHTVPDFEEWATLGDTLFKVGRNAQWWIGDWLVAGDQFYQEKAAQAIDMTGLGYDAIATYRWVSESIPPDQRVPQVSWSHHRSAAGIEDADLRLKLLEQARDELLSARDFEALVRSRARAVPADEVDEDDDEDEEDETTDPLTEGPAVAQLSMRVTVAGKWRQNLEESVDRIEKAWTAYLTDKGISATFEWEIEEK